MVEIVLHGNAAGTSSTEWVIPAALNLAGDCPG